MVNRPRPPRPSGLIDALDAHERISATRRVWRVVREGYDPLRGARSGGRWDDGTFDVLYTSLTRHGAVAERGFHLSQGQPVFPSRPKYFVHQIEVSLSAMLDLSGAAQLQALGLNAERFGALSYAERHQEYPSTQQIAEVANFLEFDGLLVPSARSTSSNLVIIRDRIKPGDILEVDNASPIDWDEWSKRRK